MRIRQTGLSPLPRVEQGEKLAELRLIGLMAAIETLGKRYLWSNVASCTRRVNARALSPHVQSELVHLVTTSADGSKLAVTSPLAMGLGLWCTQITVR